MASQSPAVAAENSGSAEDDYLQGWAALSQMMQAGVSWSGRERNCGFVNLGQGRFVDASYPSGLDFVDDGRAVAVVDWDADGDLDLWLRNRTGPQLRYMRNELRSRPPFVALWLEGRTANRDAVGASVTLRAGGKLQRRDVTTGDGYLAQSSRWLHFGLQHGESIEQVVIRWPGGQNERLSDLQPGRRYRIRQGEGIIGSEPVGGAADTCATSREVESRPASGRAVVLKTPLPLPPSLLQALAHDPTRPGTLVNLWAHWCEPCLTELREFSSAHARLSEAGAALVARCVDASEDRQAAAERFEQLVDAQAREAGFLSSWLDEGYRDTIDVLLQQLLGRHDELVLPTSLLIDARGRLQIVYLGRLKPEQLEQDLRRFLVDGVQGSRRSAFAGRWYYRSPRGYRALADELNNRGREGDAVFYYGLAKQAKQPNR